MRKLLISLIAVAALGTGTVFAQSGFWAGISGGYPGASVLFGVENVFAGLDVRASVGYNYYGFGNPGFGFGVDVLYGLDVDTGALPVAVYVGGGPSFSFAGGNLGISVNALVGGEYALAELGIPELSVFLEVGPAVRVLPVPLGIDFVGRLGVNYRF